MVSLLRAYVGMSLCSGILLLFWLSILPLQTQSQAFPISVYRHIIGTLDGRSCPSYPVCSVYATQALRQHGLWYGSWLMLDRLIHEADDVHQHQLIVFEGETRFYDPLSRNDFWLSK